MRTSKQPTMPAHAKYAADKGLSEGAAGLHVNLNLAKQVTPVTDVGAARNITTIIFEGKELEIKISPYYCWDNSNRTFGLNWS